MIPSVAWAQDYKLKRIHFIHNYKDFLRKKVTELANKMIIDPIIEEMRKQGVSRKIYENVELQTVVISDIGIYLRIHSEYYAESGFDVALAREKGTEDHMIRPRRKLYLSWIQNGKRRFSSGHKVSGLPKLNIIEKIIEKNQYELQQKLNEEFKKWRNEVLGQ